MTITRRKDEQGFALVTTTVIVAILLLSGISLLNYTVSVRKAGKSVQDEFNAIQLAEAGLQKALFCLNETTGTNCGGTYGTSYTGETDVVLGDGTFTTVLSGTGSIKTITSTGTTPSGATKTIMTEATTEPVTDDPTFGFALQTGGGGVYLENNSTIGGTIYSNGNVTCQTSAAIIDGDAYSAASGGTIDACTVNFDAYADNIINSQITGDAYYDVDPDGIAGSTVTGTKYPGSTTPSPEDLPDINLDFWHAAAEEGGTINGDYYPADGESLGPKKIVGDLIVGNLIDVTITGPIWVVGDITTGNNSTFTLDSSFGMYSTAILADHPGESAIHGKIDITNNTGIYGSGDSKSHILFISTNTSTDTASPALRVANNASGAVFLATGGLLKLDNLAGAKSLSAYQLRVSQNASINWVESELANAAFANSPGGRWRLVAAAWREQN
jgi:hypothetical protein